MPLHRVKLKRTTVEVTEILVETGDPLAIERSLHSGNAEIWEHADITKEWDGEVTDTWFKVEPFVGIRDGDDGPEIMKLDEK